jgi:hypothetical protein
MSSPEPNLDAADAILAERFTLRLPGLPPVEGRGTFKQALAEWRDAFPDWEISIEELIAEVTGWRHGGAARAPTVAHCLA